MTTIKLNETIPDVTMTLTSGHAVQLSHYKGKNVILYFYPKDNTPGCTQEAQDFRDYYPQFTAANAVILGVSRDSLKSHEGFKTKHALPFDLISDSNASLCQLFDVLKVKNMYGKQVIGIERSTFLIDQNGVLRSEWRKVKVKGHYLDVLNKVTSLEL